MAPLPLVLSSSVVVPSPPSQQPPEQAAFVVLSKWAFRATWLGIFALHGVCIGYFATVAVVYRSVPSSYLDVCLDFYALGMKNTHYPVISTVHACIAAVHGVLAILMVLWSLWKRQLSFGPLQDSASHGTHGQAHDRGLQSRHTSMAKLRRPIGMVYSKLFSRTGLFGVESAHFDWILIAREALETALQTYQAYRMSSYVPRAWLNRLYVGLLVFNCWSTPLIQVLTKRNVMRRRLVLLLCDALLDMFASVGIPVILVVSYLRDYSFEVGGFDVYYWYNDVWLVHVMNEFQLILVSSWNDLLSRVSFAVGLIGCIESLKDMVQPHHHQQQHQQQHKQKSQVSPTPASGPDLASILGAAPPPPSKGPALPSTAATVVNSHHHHKGHHHRAKLFIHSVFFIWGFIVLALQLYAETNPYITQCLMQVRPWLTRKPACALLLMDCAQDNVVGLASDIAPQWEIVDEATVTRVLIRHCPQLHMPATLQQFHRLAGMKLYNTTILEWGDSAALTNTYHPAISSLLLVRVNTTGGQLPMGMLASDFPQLLYDIELCVTNVDTLPDDLDTKWLVGSYLYVEYSQFTTLPPVLARLQPNQLSFAANQFTQFPSEIFQIDGLIYVSFSMNPIASLASKPYQDVVDIGSIGFLYLLATQISSLPRWVDPVLKRCTEQSEFSCVYMKYTPFCSDMAMVLNDTLTSFPSAHSTPADELSTVMAHTNATLNLESLQTRISCRLSDLAFYPLAFEDSWSGGAEISDAAALI